MAFKDEVEIKEVTLERKFNIGNYESLNIGLTVSPAPDCKLSIAEILLGLNTEILNSSPKLKNRQQKE